MKPLLVSLVLVLAAGCGSSSGGASSKNAGQIAKSLKSSVSTAQSVQVLTATTDPNDLMGRPHQYRSAAVITDSNAKCSDGPGVDCGATVEVFANDGDAKARFKYIDNIVSKASAFAEYDYVKGSALLRVAGALKPDQAKAYKDAFENPSSSTAGTPTQAATAADTSALRTAVQAYSDAFLTGDAKASYALLSARCKTRVPAAKWAGIVSSAKSQYGSALPLKSFDADVSGDMARVTYTYSVAAINQDQEPWVREAGAWREDDC